MRELSDALPDVLAPELGAVTVENLRRLSGGASRATWAFDAADRRLILRTGPPDDVHAGMKLEARAQRLAAHAGARVPHILVADDSTATLGLPYLICDFIEGETLGPRILRALRDDTARD